MDGARGTLDIATLLCNNEALCVQSKPASSMEPFVSVCLMCSAVGSTLHANAA